jgi:hypothetical protein
VDDGGHGGEGAAACVLSKENADQRWLIDNEAQVTLANMGRASVGAWPRAAAS